MSIRWVTSLLGLLLTVTIMVTAGLSWNVYSSFTKMVEADVQYLNLMQVSRELLQSSYDLTRKAREYVNTGDEASERAYYDILAQRSGRVPRKSSLAPGETISLPSLLERYGASRGDMEFLATALRRSDDLSITEIEAMQASKGEALCPDGLHSGSDTIDVEYARRLLFNAAYQKRAGEIIKLVESGITSILDRKSHQIEAYKRSVVYHMKELGASIAVVFLIALMWIWYGMKKVSQPLRETTLFAHRVAEGEAESSIAVSGLTKSRNCGPCSTSCSAACKKMPSCCVSFPILIRSRPSGTAAASVRCCPMSCGACRKRKGRGLGWRSSTWIASKASTIRSAMPPGIWSCGVRKTCQRDAPRLGDVRTARRG